MSKTAVYIVITFTFLSCNIASFNVEPCQYTEEDVVACEDFREMPNGGENFLLRITSIYPNPPGEDVNNEEITLRNYSTGELKFRDFQYFTKKGEKKNFTGIIANLDDNYVLAGCDSVKIVLQGNDILPNNGGYFSIVKSILPVTSVSYTYARTGKTIYFTKDID